MPFCEKSEHFQKDIEKKDEHNERNLDSFHWNFHYSLWRQTSLLGLWFGLKWIFTSHWISGLMDFDSFPNPKSFAPFHFLNYHCYNGCLSIYNLFVSRFVGRRVSLLTCLEWQSLNSMSYFSFYFSLLQSYYVFFFNFNFI